MRQDREAPRGIRHGAGLGLFALVVGGALACSSSQSPEDFCKGWVESTCAAVTTCCQSGSSFDPETCQIELSSQCLDNLSVEQVHSGEVVFDSGAASECAGEILTCTDLSAGQTASYERTKACGTMLTGFRPVGAACSSSAECEKGGDFAYCYDGLYGGTGVCVKPYLSEDNTCSFSFDTMELSFCPDGTFCDTSTVEPNPASPPSQQGYQFTASCKAYLGVNETCRGTTGTLRCGAGLYCSYTDDVCLAYVPEGQSCANGEECAPGLDCTNGTAGRTCQVADSSFCYRPPVCGDGQCDTGEQQSCPQDCGGGCGLTDDPCYSPADCCSGVCTAQYTCT